jgi:hypothetical protein
MTIRSFVLFAHLIGMLALFVALAVEWLTLELVRSAAAAGPPSPAIRALRLLPRFTAIAVGLILASGIYLAAQFGVLRSAWVGVSFAAMVLMAVLGGSALRPVIRAAAQRTRVSRIDDVVTLRRHAAHPFLRTSLHMRIAAALALVYLMIAKPDLLASSLVVAVALALGAAATLVRRDSQVGDASIGGNDGKTVARPL